MHRHGYQGKKFGRKKDQRSALILSLAEALIKNESIETTLTKAKETVSYVEKLITKAKKNDLHNRRQIIASLQTVEAATKLIDEIAPKMSARTSGHLRITKTRFRRGDNAPLAKISFVDDLNAEGKAVKSKPAVKASVAASSSKKPKTKPVGATTKDPKTAGKKA